MKSRFRRKTPGLLYRRLWRALLALVLLICLYGFISCTQVAVFKQAHFAPGSEHPWDFEAEGWLALGMVFTAFLFLSARTTPPRWLHKRVGRAKTWRAARAGGHARPFSGKLKTRTPSRSGYNKRDDT